MINRPQTKIRVQSMRRDATPSLYSTPSFEFQRIEICRNF